MTVSVDFGGFVDFALGRGSSGDDLGWHDDQKIQQIHHCHLLAD
jgi:hypothetical protein